MKERGAFSDFPSGRTVAFVAMLGLSALLAKDFLVHHDTSKVGATVTDFCPRLDPANTDTTGSYEEALFNLDSGLQSDVCDQAVEKAQHLIDAYKGKTDDKVTRRKEEKLEDDKYGVEMMLNGNYNRVVFLLDEDTHLPDMSRVARISSFRTFYDANGNELGYGGDVFTFDEAFERRWTYQAGYLPNEGGPQVDVVKYVLPYGGLDTLQDLTNLRVNVNAEMRNY